MVQGCDFVVHTASPYVIGNIKNAQELLVEPAVKGTENVLNSVNKASSVKRVVITSSLVAVYGEPAEKGKGHTYTEKDWNTVSSVTNEPYYYSKRLAEEAAWKMCEAQSSWNMVSINPGAIYGPPTSDRMDGSSIGLMKQVMDGTMWPLCPCFNIGTVDVRDVAKAHVLGLTSKASEPSERMRYICISKVMTFLDIADLLREKYGAKYCLPKGYAPTFLLSILGPILGGVSVRFVWKNSNVPLVLDNSKIKKDLGMEFRALGETMIEMADCMIELGLIKKK